LNIIWSNPDRQRTAGEKIHILPNVSFVTIYRLHFLAESTSIFKRRTSKTGRQTNLKNIFNLPTIPLWFIFQGSSEEGQIMSAKGKKTKKNWQPTAEWRTAQRSYENHCFGRRVSPLC
jgi:hypothetical protein